MRAVGRPVAPVVFQNFNEEESRMSDQKKKGKHHEQETIKPGKSRKDELSEKDLDKASGGGYIKIDF